MKNGKHLIAMCVGDLQYDETAQMAQCMANAAADKGCIVYVYNMSTADDRGAYDIFRLINYKETDGVLIFTRSIPNPTAALFVAEKAKEHGVPVATIDGKIDGCVNIEYEYGDAFADIVRHIIKEHGCRRIDMMAGTAGNAFSQARIDAFYEVLAENNIPAESAHIYHGDFWHDPTIEAMKQLFANEPEMPDAIVCANDASAIAVCEALNAYGYNVPGHVIVTGFDGITEGKANYPSLTTAEQDMELACKKAVEVLIDTPRDQLPTDVFIPFTLNFCQSCGCRDKHMYDQNKAIQTLTNELAGCYGFDDYIIEFGNRMITADNVDDAEAIIREFSFQRTLVCINESYYDFSCDMTYDPEKPFSNVMRVASHRVVDEYKFGERVLFGDVIPAATTDEEMKTMTLSLSTIRFGNVTLGYVAIPLFLERRYYRMLNKYMRMLAQSLTMLHSKQYMTYLFSHDPLTALFNRRGFFKQMRDMLEDNIGSKFVLNIFSFDIDNLKKINDTYGHSEGDFAIKSIADALISAAGTDSYIIARFGGDEFIAASISSLNDSTPKEYADKVTECLNTTNDTSMKPYKLIASCGFNCTEITPDIKIDEVISSADMMMYREKAEHKRSAPRTD